MLKQHGRRVRPAHLAACAILLASGALVFAATPAFARLQEEGATPGNGVGSAFELAFWNAVVNSKDRAQFEAYLAQYPTGTFSALARAKIAAIDKAARPAASAAPAPVAAPAPAPVAAPVPPAPAPEIASEGGDAAIAPSAVAPPPAAPVAAPVPAPVPVLVPAPAPAPAVAPVVPAPAPAAPVTSAAEPAPAAAPEAPAKADPFAKAAAARAARAAAAAAPAGTTAAPAAPPPGMPVRPVPEAVPVVTLPEHFCSAEARNSFHDTVYKPAMAAADRNNQAAIAYIGQLQADYDARSKRGDVEGANVVAKEAGAYKPIAETAFATRNAFTGLFDKIMAVPITTCK